MPTWGSLPWPPGPSGSLAIVILANKKKIHSAPEAVMMLSISMVLQPITAASTTRHIGNEQLCIIWQDY